MPGSSKSIDDNDNAAKLMPNVAKLIRADSDSLESNGSTPVSLCGISGNDNNEAHNGKPCQQRRAEAVLRDVANKFFRRGATGARSIGCAPSTLDMLSSCRRIATSSANRRNVYMFEKENLRPKASTLVKQGTLPIIQQNIAMRDTSQKAAWELRRYPTRSVVKIGQRWTVNPKTQGADKSNTDKVPVHLAKHAATVTSPRASHSSQGSEGSRHVPNLAAKSRRGKAKLYVKTTPFSLSELQEKFAELDGEALEEEEVSIAHLTTVRPVLASETELQHADDISENVVENRKDLSRCGREDEVRATLNPNLEEAAVPNYSYGQGQEGIGICTSQSKLSKTPGRDQDVQVSEPTCKGTARGNLAASSGTNCDAVTRPERQLSPSGCLNLHDGDERDDVKCRIDENPPRFEDSSSPSVNGTEDKAKTADMKAPRSRWMLLHKSSVGRAEVSVQNLSWNMLKVAATTRDSLFSGYSSLKPNEGNFKEMTADGADANASHREDTALGHTLSLREGVQSAPLKAEGHLEQEGAPDRLQEGAYPTRESSATPARNALLLTCLHYSRIGRSTDMSQRRLVFDSSSESLSRQKVVDRNTENDSVSTVEFKGRTDPATDVLNPDVHEYDASVTPVPHQEAKLPFTDDEVDERGCTSQSSKPNAATHYEDVVEREAPLTGSLAQDDNLPDFEASRGVVGTDPGIDSLGPQAGPATEVPKARGLAKRTWANLGDPIDGGTEWKKGRRVSTRIKSRPLDWWRGERMLYGRVHSTLCTLIGIKTTSPDPIWPRPKPQRGDYNTRNFHVDSYVGDSHRDLLRLAAQ